MLQTVADLLVSKVFFRFGPPLVPHSDQGSNFESTLMHEICNIMGITKTRPTAYHPSGDGRVERQNRTLQDVLSNYVSNRVDDWDLWLDPVLFALEKVNFKYENERWNHMKWNRQFMSNAQRRESLAGSG